MGAVWMLARADVRRRLTAVVVLALLVGISGGAVLAAVAGARRTSSAMDRFERESRTATFEVTVGTEYTADQIRALRRVPVVEGLAVLWQVSLYKPEAGFLPIAAPVDDSFGTVVDRGRIVQGRQARGVHELTIGEGLTKILGVGLGDEITFGSFTQQQIEETFENEFVPRGPDVTFEIVGIVRRPLDLGVRGEVGGVVVPTRAFFEEYRDRIGSFSGAVLRVRTANGERDSAALAAAVQRIFGDDVDFESLGLEGRGARSAIDVMTAGLWILAAITAAAATVAVGLALARRATDVKGEQDVLASLGVRRAQRWAASTLPVVPIAVGGSAFAVLVAVVVSPIFPLGVAAKAETDGGVAFDASVLGVGFVGLAGGVLMLGALVAFLATRRASDAPDRPSMWSRAIGGLDVPPTAGVGVAFALERGRGRRSVPVWSAIGAVILAVAGVVASGSFAATLDDLVTEPERFGWTWDYVVEGMSATDGCESGGELGRDPAIEAVAAVCYGDVTIDGRPSVAWAFAPLRGRVDPSIIDGHAPRNGREVALGAGLQRSLDRGLGDTVRFSTDNGPVRRRVVGTFVMPPVSDPLPLADSALLTSGALKRNGEITSDLAVVRVRDGANRAAFLRGVRSLDTDIAPPRIAKVPVEIERLRQIDALPFVLAILIVLIGVVALAYTLVVTIRRHAVDLAILKVLGFGRAQVRRTVAWQASTIGIVGIVVGTVLGLVVGQFVWKAVAHDLGVGDALTVPVVGLLLLLPLTLLVVNVIAALPARTAARTRPAVVLRSE